MPLGPVILLAALLAPVVLLAQPPDPGVEFSGQVRERGTRAPLPGARVTLLGGGGALEAICDGEGRFLLRGIERGRYRLRIRPAPGFAQRPYEEAVQLPAGKSARRVFYLRPPVLPEAPVFSAKVRGESEPVAGDAARYSLTGEELRKLPGTLGDPLRSVENLPGMGRPPFNTGLFIIEGGRPSDSRAYVGLSEVPQLYHYGGFTSVVPGTFLSQIEYLPHNFSVRYGRATAGTINVDLRAGRRDRLHGAFDVNVIHAAAELEGPIKKGSFLLGVRRSYIDAGLQLASAAIGDPPGLRFVRAPVYWDYQAILDYPIAGGQLRLMVFGADDQLQLLFERPQDADPTLSGAFSTHVQFHRVQARYKKTYGAMQLFAQGAFGYNRTELGLGRGIRLDVSNIGFDLRAEGRYEMGRSATLLFGTDTQGAYVMLDARVPSPLREGEFQRPPGSLSQVHEEKSAFLLNPAFYAELALRPHPRVQATLGLRADLFSELRRANLDPRLTLRAQLSPLTWLRLGAGLYTQDPAVQDYFGETFANPRLRLERAAHLSVTVEQGIWRGLMLEVTGLYKHLWDFAAPSTLSRRTEAAPLGRPEFVASKGGGRIYGGTVLLRQSLSRYLFGWASYSLLRSERTDCSGCDYRLFDFDQTHVFVLILHAYLPYRFEVGLRYRYVSGVPHTPASAGFFDSDTDLYQPSVGLQNSERLGPFNQLDVRIDHTFAFKTWVLKIYLDVSNVYNLPAPEQMAYGYDYTRRAPLTGLPIVPSLGLRGEF